MLLPSVPRLRIKSWGHSSNILVSPPTRRCITLIPAYNGDPAPGGSNGDGTPQRKSSKGDNFSKPSRRKGREAHLRSPYDTPLRDGNRDRLIGLLTERAAKTLMVYLMETNVMLHNWLVNFYKENAIPRIGPWDEVSGEAFLRKLLAMPISSAKVELGRDALFDNSAECGVDPRSMAQRIMDIRTQLATEFVQDLMGVKEENTELLRETLASSLMGGLAVHPTVPFPAPAEDNTTNASSNGNGNGKGSGGTATKARPLSAGRKPYDPGEGRRKRPIYKAPSTDSSVLRNWRLEALYSSSSDEDSHPIEDVPHLPTPTSFSTPGSGSAEPPKLPPKFQTPPVEPPYKAYMDAAAAADPSLFFSISSSSSLDSASDDEGKKGLGDSFGAANSGDAAALGNGDAAPPTATPAAPIDSSSGGDSHSNAVPFNIAAAEAAFSAPAATPAATPEPAVASAPPADATAKPAPPEVPAAAEVAGPTLQPSEVSAPEATSNVTAPATTASTEASTPPVSISDAPTAPAPSSVSAPTISNNASPTNAAATDIPVSSSAAAAPSAPAKKRGPPTEKQLSMMHPEIAEMMRNNTGDWQDLYPEIAAVLEQEAAVQHQPSETKNPDADAPPPPSPDTPQPKA